MSRNFTETAILDKYRNLKTIERNNILPEHSKTNSWLQSESSKILLFKSNYLNFSIMQTLQN